MAFFYNKHRVVNVKEEETPMYRSYGKTKTIRPWQQKLNDTLVKFVTLLMLFPMVLIVALIAISVLIYADTFPALALPSAMASIVLLIVLYFSVFRMPRKRIRFLRKLERACVKNGYKLTYKRNFFESMSWSDDESIDLIVRAGGYTYYVKMFGAQKKRSDIIFCQNGEMIYRKLRLKNKLTLIFDLKPRQKIKKICFPRNIDGEKTVRAIVLNPVPGDIYKKKATGDIEISGNQDTMFGYTVFSGSGFIECLRRNAEEEKRQERNIEH